MFRSVALVFTVLGSVACAGTTPNPESSPVAERAPIADEQKTSDTSSSPESSRSHSSSSGSDEFSKTSTAVARRSSEPPVAGDAVDISDFCESHHIQADLKDIERCVATPLGTKPDEQLWCSRREELDDNRVAYYLALYRVQGQRLAKVIEFAYAAGPKPLAERENDFTYYVKLFPDMSADAKSFEVREETSLGCSDALTRVRDEFTVYPDIEKPVEQLVQKVCASRGKYSASGQRLKQ
jgi:transglutaminase/protease-like cytokinesis protein 3